MSFGTVTSGLFAVKPKVWVEGERLIGRTGLLGSLLVLFFWGRKVIVDRGAQEVIIETRLFWLIVLVRKVPFGRIGGIGYRVRSLPTQFSLFYGATDEMEFLTVSLELLEPRDSDVLFRFVGEGAIETGGDGVFWGGDDWVDFKGDQAVKAMEYVRALEGFTGKKMVVMD